MEPVPVPTASLPPSLAGISRRHGAVRGATPRRTRTHHVRWLGASEAAAMHVKVAPTGEEYVATHAADTGRSAAHTRTVPSSDDDATLHAGRKTESQLAAWRGHGVMA